MSTLAFKMSTSDREDFESKVAFIDPCMRTNKDMFGRGVRECSDLSGYEIRGTFRSSVRALVKLTTEESILYRNLQDAFGDTIGGYVALKLMGKDQTLVNNWRNYYVAR